MNRGHTITAHTLLLIERASYPLILLPTLTDYLENNALPRTPREYATEILLGLLILGYVLFVRRARKRLEEVEDLRRSLTDSVVHDLKHPVAAMKGAVELIKDKNQPPKIKEEMLDIAGRACDTQLRFIELVLETSRLESGELAPRLTAVPAAAILEDTLREMQGAASAKDIQILMDSGSGLPPVHADKLLIERVLMNFISNAIKYTPRRGTITMKVSLAGGGKGACHLFEVNDTGPGIAPEQAEKLFRKYSRIETPGLKLPGTGIGLYFCRLAVKAHGGEISFADNGEQGASFRFSIPLHTNRQ